ncbi:MAG: hypothetical protein IKE46_00355 [Selenomonadaceae bacterium]|nr:hypothetical protein [Selenomonadaceae bacterium]MBR3747227.1 hypothetical protein [Selenomonadaceae bacterium]
MDKQVYIALENWENFNDCINDVSETLQSLSTKAFSTEILIQELARLVEQRLILWQQIEGFGFKSVWQARAALFQENERREHNHELSKEA